MTANPYFYTKVAIEKIRYHPLASEQSGYNRYRSSELDVIPNLPTSELEGIKTSSDQSVQAALRLTPLLSSMYLVFNLQDPAFQDVRRAQGTVYGNRSRDTNFQGHALWR